MNLKMDGKCASLHSCRITLGERTLRSMKTAQPGIIRGINNRMFMVLFVQIVHVLDVYIVVCMQRCTTCFLFFFLPYIESERISLNSQFIF